jgi:hypothetical protein
VSARNGCADLISRNTIKFVSNKQFLKQRLLNKIKTKLRQFDFHEAARRVLLIVSALSVFDVVVSVLLGKSRTVILLSDLLFLEGTVIFAIGIFIAVARAWQETTPSSETARETTDNVEQTAKRQIHFGMLMVIVGAILIGLSITVGTLLL